MGGCWGRRSRFSSRWSIAVRDLMQGAYPELVDSAARVAKVVEAEEKQFDRVLKIGLHLGLNEGIAERASLGREGFSSLRDLWAAAGLHGRCGARCRREVRRRGLRERSRGRNRPAPALAGRAAARRSASPAFRDLPKTDFEGYRQLNSHELRSAGHREGWRGRSGGRGRRFG